MQRSCLALGEAEVVFVRSMISNTKGYLLGILIGLNLASFASFHLARMKT